jgi:tetratricopeptide (TPR) repeat protein
MLAGCALLTGCQSPATRVARTPPETTPNLSAVQKADVQFAMARSMEKGGDLAQASAMYQDVLKKDPRRADALDRLAVIHARQGQFEQAVAEHKKAIVLQPANADFHCNLGYCYYLQKRWAEAEMELQKAIELAANNQRAQNNLGLVLAHTERSQQAFDAFRRAGCTEADAHNNLAFVLTLTGSLAEAKEHYARARELGPSSPATDNGLRVVTARLATSQNQDASRLPGQSFQDAPRAAELAAPPIGKIQIPLVPLLAPVPATESPLPPPPVDVGPAPRASALQGPIPVDGESKLAPAPADIDGMLAPPRPVVNTDLPPANDVGEKKEIAPETSK